MPSPENKTAESLRAQIARDGATFAIIVHGRDIIINLPFAISTMRIGGAQSLTILTESEKKIIAISDVVKLD